VSSPSWRPEVWRRGRALKWTAADPDVLPLWVADMDLEPPPAVRARLAALAAEGWLGYELVPGDPALAAAVRAALVARGHPGLPEPLRGVVGPGLLSLLYGAVRTLTAPGEAVAVLTPTYPPFLSAVREQGRALLEVPLDVAGPQARLDLDALEAAFRAGARLLLWCQPHNPTGRVWSDDEQASVAALAARHDVRVVSDEVWADLWLDAPPRPFAAASREAEARTLTLVGPCKTYNMAGLPIGMAVSADPALLAPLRAVAHGLGHPGQLPVAMWECALAEAGPWLAATRDALRARRDQAMHALAELPGVRVASPEATYLLWIDGRRHPLGAGVHRALLDEGRVLLNDGASFGEGFAGCVRLNFATTEARLAEALERVTRVLGARPTGAP
jgi:cystathionine beta-lyase